MSLIFNSQKSIWNVLYTRPRYEKKILEEMERNKIEGFLPLRTEIRQWSDRKKKIEVPLFPNYIFVSASRNEMLRVLSINGVLNLVNFNGKPAVVSEEEIGFIKKMSGKKAEVSNEDFQMGQECKVINGPLSGVEGKLVEKKGKTRLVVRIDGIEQSILVDISPADLEKI